MKMQIKMKMGGLDQFRLLKPKKGTTQSSEMPVTIWVQTPMPGSLQDLDLQVFEYNELRHHRLSVNSQFVGQNIIYFSTSQIQALYSAMYEQTGPCL
jgi:hypothetical protein